MDSGVWHSIVFLTPALGIRVKLDFEDFWSEVEDPHDDPLCERALKEWYRRCWRHADVDCCLSFMMLVTTTRESNSSLKLTSTSAMGVA